MVRPTHGHRGGGVQWTWDDGDCGLPYEVEPPPRKLMKPCRYCRNTRFEEWDRDYCDFCKRSYDDNPDYYPGPDVDAIELNTFVAGFVFASGLISLVMVILLLLGRI